MEQLEFLPTLPSLLSHPKIPLIHRDISWMQFNERVLAEARQSTNPLLERVKFLAISASNLDEFFMIRFASLGRSILNMAKSDPHGSARLTRIRDSLLETVAKFGAKQAEAFDILDSELDSEGIHLIRGARTGEEAFEIGQKIFAEMVLSKLPLPEPFAVGKLSQLENLQMGLVFDEKPQAQWIKIPKTLAPVYWAPSATLGQHYFFFLDDLLNTHAGSAFNLNSKNASGILKVTRDGDISMDLEEEDTESIPDVVRSNLGSRDRGRVVRLQYLGDLRDQLLHEAADALKIVAIQVLPAANTLCLNGLWTLINQCPEEIASKPGLKYQALPTLIPKRLRVSEKIFDEIREKDILLHHPYDSFDGFVSWIHAACQDPHVTLIEQTVYRMDTLSPVIAALKEAASRKRVRVIIELRARFDELNNLRLADELRKAGVEVAFGFGKLKLHAKIVLVTRMEDGVERLYTHLSTGNYNAATARQYTDLAILTSHPAIGADARSFFDSVLKGQIPTSFKQLVSAPTRLHRRLLNYIQAETAAALAGRKARIVAKVNALVDPVVVDHLYKASQAGVRVDLIVRGACSLIPGVKGLSDHIQVISVVDRFLEHSRIYYFEDSKAMYLSSADWMPRNFFSRLEIAFPVLDQELYKYIESVIIPAYLMDTVKARQLTPQGTWKKHTKASVKRELRSLKPVRSQFHFAELARLEYHDTVLEKK